MAKKRGNTEIIEIAVSSQIGDYEDSIRPTCFGEYCDFCDSGLCDKWLDTCKSSSSLEKS